MIHGPKKYDFASWVDSRLVDDVFAVTAISLAIVMIEYCQRYCRMSYKRKGVFKSANILAFSVKDDECHKKYGTPTNDHRNGPTCSMCDC